VSITLSQAASLNINGSVVESDANAALYYMEVNFPGEVRLFYAFGTTSGQSFTAGAQVPRVIINLNLHTGVWTSSNGLSGTVSGGGFTTAQGDFVTLANLAETLAVNAGVISGTQVAWTTGVF